MGRIFGWWGASDMISILVNANLANEFVLSIQPVIRGNGIPLVQRYGKTINLQLLGSNTFKIGLTQTHYAA